MNIRLTLLALPVLLASLSANMPVWAADTTLKNVRIWNAPDHSRVVFDVSETVDYSLFTLQDPDRVVIDIKQARWKDAERPEIDDGGYVKGLRSAYKPSSGTLRLVLDTDREIKPKSFLLKPNDQYGHRLVVDLFQSKEGPAQAVKTARQEEAKYRDVVIAIDAGHGGEDPGASGPRGTKEKHITLQVAKKLADMINQQKGMKAVLIREGDYYLKLRKRIAKAREHRADLFVSLHADAFHKPDVRGSSVYILSDRGATSEAARWLAKKENDSDLIGGVTLEDKDDLLAEVLLDLSQTATIEASADFAQTTLRELKRVGKTHRKHVDRAGFAVLKSPDIPSILVELAFISNPTEEKNLRSSDYQKRMAAAIMKGMRGYLTRRPPDNTLFAVRTHKIERGDTLSGLAERYQVSYQQLKLANNLDDDTLRIGQVLRIPTEGS